MKLTPADEFRNEIERLEREFALLSGGSEGSAEVERRLSNIGAALDMLRADLQRLHGS